MEQLRISTQLDKRYLGQLIDMDREIYQLDPSPTFLSIADLRADLYTVLTVNDRPVGYGLILPLKRFVIEALRLGEIHEDEIRLRHLKDWSTADGFYIAAIASNKAQSTVYRSRIIGYAMGQILRVNKPVIGVAISAEIEVTFQEISSMTPYDYKGPIQGVAGFKSILYELSRPGLGNTRDIVQ